MGSEEQSVTFLYKRKWVEEKLSSQWKFLKSLHNLQDRHAFTEPSRFIESLSTEISNPDLLALQHVEGGTLSLYERYLFYGHDSPTLHRVLNFCSYISLSLFPQRLTKEFRIAYCRLWQSILQADLSRIQATASALGCDETLAPLMACMVSGRSWRAIQGGVVARESRNDLESREIAGNVGTYLPQIAQVLDRVPRQMLLLFKTNDLLRGIESALRGTAGRVAHSLSLVVMMRCCLRSLLVSGDLPFLSRLHTRWQLLSLTLYQYYLRFLVSLELY